MGNEGSNLNFKGNSKILKTKLETSKKTGVLNLEAQKLTATSSVWGQIDVAGIRLIDISRNPLKSLPVEIYSMSNLK
jgi:hypothetical protein